MSSFANPRFSNAPPPCMMPPREDGCIDRRLVHQIAWLLIGERVFWDAHDPEKAIVIRLRDKGYARLVIEVDDPPATVAAIQEALGR
jgi:hypothetical protein